MMNGMGAIMTNGVMSALHCFLPISPPSMDGRNLSSQLSLIETIIKRNEIKNITKLASPLRVNLQVLE
jgi:hypothetical protein